MKNCILFFCCIAWLAACKESPKQTETEQVNSQVYPSLPARRLQDLLQVCDYIDFVFYNTNFSMNQGEPSSIQSTIRGVAAQVPVIKPECKAVGHLFFQSQGQILLEADLYFSPGCIYYTFFENGKPAYANELTPEGAQFYNNIFKTYLNK